MALSSAVAARNFEAEGESECLVTAFVAGEEGTAAAVELAAGVVNDVLGDDAVVFEAAAAVVVADAVVVVVGSELTLIVGAVDGEAVEVVVAVVLGDEEDVGVDVDVDDAVEVVVAVVRGDKADEVAWLDFNETEDGGPMLVLFVLVVEVELIFAAVVAGVVEVALVVVVALVLLGVIVGEPEPLEVPLLKVNVELMVAVVLAPEVPPETVPLRP